ncbi:MAG: T9SS type A sorting domain-containing protein [Owenweeksia sp.]
MAIFCLATTLAFSQTTNCIPFASNIANDTLCTAGLTGFTAGTGNYVAHLNGANQVDLSGEILAFPTFKDTTVALREAVPTNNTGHVGPLTSIAAAGFGNFTNGQYITVIDTIRIDSMTVRSNGVLTAQVVISADASGTTEIQRSKPFTTGAATADYKVEVGLVLTPGIYFMNVTVTGGLGLLFRTTGGAVYPYVLPGLMSIDSTNFTTQNRIYYTFDLVVTEVCLGNPISVTSYIVAYAGEDVSLAYCDNGAADDLNNYLPDGASAGGSYSSVNASAAISGSTFNPSVLTAGNYTVIRTVPAAAGCPADTAVFDIRVDACVTCVGLTSPTLTGDTICGPGSVTITANTTAKDVIWYDDVGEFIAYGNSITDNISTSTNYKASAILSSGPLSVVGPSYNISSNTYPTSNFTNGQWITVYQNVRIDSATFAVNGALNFVVVIQDPARTNVLQTSKVISFAAADTAQKEVGIFLTPGVYFINTSAVSGTGILYRPTGGGNYPYGINNLVTVDSSDFGPTRYYYLYEMVISGACISTMDSVMGVVATPAAGPDAAGAVCSNNTAVDLSLYLSGADAGGTWLDDNSTGALTTNIFDATQVATGSTYAFTYVVVNGPCADSATVSLTIEGLPEAGMDNRDTLCDTGAVVDIASYLSLNAQSGGMWIDASASGALTGSIFDPSQVAVSTTYTIQYVVSGVSCPSDTASFYIYVDTCGIGLEERNAADLAVYPNPTSGRLYIDNNGIGTQTMLVEINVLNGKLLMRRTFDGNNRAEIDMTPLAKGFYNLKVTTDQGVVIRRISRQ